MDQRKTILVAVGQDALAMALWRGLHARRDDLDVHLARSPQALEMLLAHAQPAIVVIEVDAPNDEGLAPLRQACAAPSSPRVVAVSRIRSPHVDDALLAEGAAIVRHAPVDVATLVDAVEAALAAEETMSGRVGHIGVLDLVQMLCLTRRSGSVRFTAAEGRGGIWLEDGEIVHAAWCEVAGMDALVRLSVLDDGVFRCFVGSPVPRR
jgi:CheY-like chemotaxis protein